MMLATDLILALGLVFGTALAAPALDGRQSQDARFSFYKLKTPAAGPCDLVAGPDGALWGQDILVNLIFRLNPQTGHVDEYPIPFTTPVDNQTIPGLNNPLVQDRTALSCAIRNGADGNLYAANGIRNQLVRINPVTKAIRVFQPPPNPAGNLQPFNDLYSAKDGIYVTQTTQNTFQFFSFKTQSFTTYTVPTLAALPLGCYVDSHGIVYIAELVGNKILTFNPETHAINEYPLPEAAQFPAVIRAERNGYVYFSLFIGNGIGRISQTTHKIEIFHTNQTGALGAEDTIDRSGGVWYSFFDVDALARLDTNTLKYSYVAFPQSFAATGANGVAGDVPPNVDVAVNYGPGNAIWFTSILNNTVGRYELDGLY